MLSSVVMKIFSFCPENIDDNNDEYIGYVTIAFKENIHLFSM